jgi:hypothetical protein
MAISPTISKSQYIKGLQCPKALWYYKNRKDLKPEIDATTQAKFDTGNAVGELAQHYFDNGVEVTNKYWDIKGAISATERYINDGYDTIYEATAMHPGHGGYSRIDILKKIPDTDEWDLIEVKSSTKVKDYHIDDLSFQYHVFHHAGYKIRRCFIMHINNQYIREGELDPKKLLQLEDITEEILSKQDNLDAVATQLVEIRKQGKEPDEAIGARCSKPFECDYKAHCWHHVPEYSIYNIFAAKKADQIYKTIESYDISDVPENLYPNGLKRIDLDCYLNDIENFDKDNIVSFLNELEYPLHYLDYETLFPAIPLFDGTHPYQQIPFQYSMHVQNEAGGETAHHEFLHKEITDPRQSFVESLISSCGNSGSFIVYNKTFEAGRNSELAELYPQYASQLLAINERMVDLMLPFKNRYLYHPDQKGSYSIKKVLPAFTDLDYNEMEITDGGDASLQYYEFINMKLLEQDHDSLWDALYQYCKLDTYAMVELTRVLNSKI